MFKPFNQLHLKQHNSILNRPTVDCTMCKYGSDLPLLVDDPSTNVQLYNLNREIGSFDLILYRSSDYIV